MSSNYNLQASGQGLTMSLRHILNKTYFLSEYHKMLFQMEQMRQIQEN